MLGSEIGTCEPYIGTIVDRLSPCDDYFTVDMDLVYIPDSRLGGDQVRLRNAVEELGAVLGFLPERCKEPITRGICTHLYLPCGTNESYHLPRFLCPDVCRYLTETLCPEEYELARSLLATQVQPEFRDDPGLQVPNCSDTQVLIESLNLTENCCTDAGVTLPSTSSIVGMMILIWDIQQCVLCLAIIMQNANCYDGSKLCLHHKEE